MASEPLIKPRQTRFSMFYLVQRLRSVCSEMQSQQKRYRVRKKLANLSEIKSWRNKSFLDRPDLRLILAHGRIRKMVNRKDGHQCPDLLNFRLKSCHETHVHQVWKTLNNQTQQTQMWKRYWWHQYETTWKDWLIKSVSKTRKPSGQLWGNNCSPMKTPWLKSRSKLSKK